MKEYWASVDSNPSRNYHNSHSLALQAVAGDDIMNIEALPQFGRADPVRQTWFCDASERAVIESALRLANMKDLRDFVDLWQRIAYRDTAPADPTHASMSSDLIERYSNQRIGEELGKFFEVDLQGFQHEQEELIGMLEKVRWNLSAARRELNSIVSNRVQDVHERIKIDLRDGYIVRDRTIYAPTLQVAVAYAIALLLDPTCPANDKRTFGDRLRRCALREDEAEEGRCGKWFLSYATGRGGPLPSYCSKECSYRARADMIGARVSTFRRKNKQRKSK